MRDRDRVLTTAMAGVGIVVGLLAGLLVGWVLWPVQYTDTNIADLKPAYQDEYILMVSAAYATSGDLEQARAQLVRLNDPGPALRVAILAEALIARGADPGDIERLVNLADALGAYGDQTPVSRTNPLVCVGKVQR
jgi:hypothetical protein